MYRFFWTHNRMQLAILKEDYQNVQCIQTTTHVYLKIFITNNIVLFKFGNRLYYTYLPQQVGKYNFKEHNTLTRTLEIVQELCSVAKLNSRNALSIHCTYG